MVAHRWALAFGLAAVSGCGTRSALEGASAGGATGGSGSGATMGISGAAVTTGGAVATGGASGDAGENPCSPNPCLNSGSCSAEARCPRKSCTWFVLCDCPPAFTGDHCETVGSRPMCGSNLGDQDCSSLLPLEFANPHFDAAHPISAGDRMLIDVTITNPGPNAVPYPCVAITTDQPTILSSSPLSPEVYAWLSGSSVDEGVPVQFTSAIPSGTPINFTLWVDVLNEGCTQGGFFTFKLVAP